MVKAKEKVACPYCGSEDWTFAGWGWRDHKKSAHRRRCSECGRIFAMPADSEVAELDRKVASKRNGKKEVKDASS